MRTIKTNARAKCTRAQRSAAGTLCASIAPLPSVPHRLRRAEFEENRARFAEELLHEQRRSKVGLFRFLRQTRLLVVLTSPIIYAGWIPFLLMDLFVTIYQWLCFPVYRIPRVRRSDYIVFGRANRAVLVSDQARSAHPERA